MRQIIVETVRKDSRSGAATMVETEAFSRLDVNIPSGKEDITHNCSTTGEQREYQPVHSNVVATTRQQHSGLQPQCWISSSTARKHPAGSCLRDIVSAGLARSDTRGRQVVTIETAQAVKSQRDTAQTRRRNNGTQWKTIHHSDSLVEEKLEEASFS